MYGYVNDPPSCCVVKELGDVCQHIYSRMINLFYSC